MRACFRNGIGQKQLSALAGFTTTGNEFTGAKRPWPTAKKSGAGVHVQACDPYCEHMFAHTDILLALTADGPRWHVVRRRGPTMAVFARGRAAKSVKEAANVAWRWCRVPFRDFADVKNLGLRILDVERRLR